MKTPATTKTKAPTIVSTILRPTRSSPSARPPGLVRRLRLIGAVDQRRAWRAVGEIGAAQIAQVVLLPSLTRQAARRRRSVRGVVQPSMPVGRHARGFGLALVNHPALAPAARAHPLVLIIAIALIVFADKLAAQF